MDFLQPKNIGFLKPDISIVVPVYNGENYLKRCVDSITLAATGHNIELILVDDGSADNSAAIAQSYCDNFPWMKLVRQENQGPSSARNKGIDAAQGHYIGFVDCDDCVAEHYFSELLAACASNPDIVVFGYQRIFANGKKQTVAPESKSHIGEQEDLLCNVNGDRQLFWFSCTKLFSSVLLTNIRFDESMRLGEDTVFNLHAVKKSNHILRISPVLYFYYEVAGSLSSNKYKPGLLKNMEKHFSSRLAVHKAMQRGLDDKAWNDIYKYYIFHILPWLFSNLMYLDNKQQLAELRNIRDSVFVGRCYAKKIMLGTGQRTILIQLMFRARLLRLLRAYCATVFTNKS